MVERRKKLQNTALCERAGGILGWWGTQRLVRLLAQKFGVPLREAGMHVHATLGSAAVKAVCRQLERGFPTPDTGGDAGEQRNRSLLAF